jgi:hypothetical protein
MLKVGRSLHNEIGTPSFSGCGRYCVVSSKKGGVAPIVVDIASESLFGNLLETYVTKDPVSSERPRNPPPCLNLSSDSGQLSKSTGSMLSILEEGSARKSVITGTRLSPRPDGSRIVMQMVNTGNSAEVWQQWTDGLQQAVEKSLTLTLLPCWSGAESLRPSVVLPNTEDEPVRIVLDKVAPTWNSISGLDSDSRFPAIIERDRRLFPSPNKKTDALMQSQAIDTGSRSHGNLLLPDRSYSQAS